MDKNQIGWIGGVLVLLAVGVWVWHGGEEKRDLQERGQERQREVESSKKRERDAGENERKQQSHDAVLSVARRYDALHDWREVYRKRSEFADIFTVEFQEVLVREDKRAIAFVGSLGDVVKRDGRYEVYFRCYAPLESGLPDIEFRLLVSDSLAKKVRKEAHSRVDESEGGFAVVARITEVARETSSHVFVSGEVEIKSEEHSGSIVPEVTRERYLIAHGECIHAEFLPNWRSYD